MEICSIILSAGKGSRMLSSTPKPLHTISGKTMIQWVIDANQSAGIKKSIIVVPQEFDKFDIKNKNVIKTIQKKPIGTGDAVRKGASLLDNFEGAVLICFADTPFITPKTLKKIVNSLNKDNDLVLTGFRKFDKNVCMSMRVILVIAPSVVSVEYFLPHAGYKTSLCPFSRNHFLFFWKSSQ